MMTKFLMSLALVGSLVTAGTMAQAQGLKIGYVDSSRVLREAAPAKVALARMEAEFSKREMELKDQAGQLKAASEKLEKDGPSISEAERNRRQIQLTTMDRNLGVKRRNFQEDLKQRQTEETDRIVARTNQVIKQIFETENYDLILQDVVFASPRVEITDKVIKALNAAPTNR